MCMAGPPKYSPRNQHRPSQSGIQTDFPPTDPTIWFQRPRSPQGEVGTTTGNSSGPQNAPRVVGKVSSSAGEEGLCAEWVAGLEGLGTLSPP